MRILEIFCGTKSMGKVFEKNGWEVISIDIEKKMETYNMYRCIRMGL